MDKELEESICNSLENKSHLWKKNICSISEEGKTFRLELTLIDGKITILGIHNPIANIIDRCTVKIELDTINYIDSIKKSENFTLYNSILKSVPKVADDINFANFKACLMLGVKK